jgi:ATP-dependent DNA helicase RecG
VRYPRPSRLAQALSLPGEKAQQAAVALGLETVGDLLEHLPRDRRKARTVAELAQGESATVVVEVRSISSRSVRRRGMRPIVEATVADDTGVMQATFFNQPWLVTRYPAGTRLVLHGKYQARNRFGVQAHAITSEALAGAEAVAHYPATEGLSSTQILALVRTHAGALTDVLEPLPAELRVGERLPDRPVALSAAHFPAVERDFEAARRRLAFDELLVLQIALAQRRARWRAEASAIALKTTDAILASWIGDLPFELTGSQKSALEQIREDLAKTSPMSRLLEGDVGSGKTVVAALAARIATASGAQTALMAPTELLAEQHERSLAALFANGGPRHALLTSSVTGDRRKEILAGLADGSIEVAVGTHALVEENVAFKRLGLAVVDEQHRFGVRQRATFREKGTGTDPHLLLTTATPIPQTLNQTIYRDLDISIINELPLGRKPIVTHLRTPEQLSKVWEGVRLAVERGQQAFVVTPRIDPAEEGGDDVPSAIATEKELRQEELRGLRIALMHGRMPAKERDAVMRRFAGREIDVLVATTVIEVGIDIPNATVMVVLGAERFGLAQLHQLRGRIGRGSERSYCVLVSEASDSERLAAITAMKRDENGREVPLDGFDLAQRDLAIRGAGEFLGVRQSGVPELRIVDLADADPELISETAEEADRIFADDPVLARPDHEELGRAVNQLWRRYGPT